MVSYACDAVLPKFCTFSKEGMMNRNSSHVQNILQDKKYHFRGTCMKHIKDETIDS